MRKLSSNPLTQIWLVSSAVAIMSIGVAARYEAIGADEQSGIVSTEFIFESAPFRSCHASTIVETRGGLLAAWFAGTAEKNADVGIWVSRRDGDRWTEPVEVANGVEPDGSRQPCWNPVLFQPRSDDKPNCDPPGESFHFKTSEVFGDFGSLNPDPPRDPPLLLFYKVGPSPNSWWGMLRTSTDAGRTWSDARRLPDGILGPIKNKPVQLADGTILAGSSTEGAERHRLWRVHFERSTDGGATWSKTPPVNDGDAIGAIQPSILIHSGGKLQAVGRTLQGRIFETWSDDAGKSWRPMSLTALPNPNSGIDAVTLAESPNFTARHLLVYNHTTKDRSPLNVAVSRDGRDWQAALVLEREPGEYSYPAVMQSRDGLVHITYTWKRRRVKHVVVDPTKLELKLIVAGAWPQ